MKNRQGDAKAELIKSDVLIRLAQNETPQKTEVQASSFRGISFGVDQDISKSHQSRLSEIPRRSYGLEEVHTLN